MSNIRQLPFKQHQLVLKAQLGTVRKNFALRDVPKIVSKLVISWAQEYVDTRRVWEFDRLWTQVVDEQDRFLENLVVLEQVPPEHLDECVSKTRNILLGVE